MSEEGSHKPHNSNNLKDWLSNLERESWQLELIVSAIAIFLLYTVKGEVPNIALEWSNNPFENRLIQELSTNAFFIIEQSVVVLLIALLIHLVLRGLWIGMLGLRSVTKEVRAEHFNYGTFFTEKIFSSYKGLDQIIINLDKWCSLIFSFSFLFIFSLFSAFLYFCSLAIISYLTSFLIKMGEANFYVFLYIIINFIYLILGLLYAFDFLTLGLLKRNNFIGKIYYPIYKFFGFITLAFLYRDIYYTLISSIKKRYFFLFVPVALGIIFFSSIDVNFFDHFLQGKQSHSIINKYYDSLRTEQDWVGRISVPSRIINQTYLPVFLRYYPKDKNLLSEECEEVDVVFNNSFFNNPILNIGKKRPEKPLSTKEQLNCLNDLYEISVNDELIENIDLHFYQHPNKGEKGVEFLLSTHNWSAGKNTLQVKKKKLSNEGVEYVHYAIVHLWLYR